MGQDADKGRAVDGEAGVIPRGTLPEQAGDAVELQHGVILGCHEPWVIGALGDARLSEL